MRQVCDLNGDGLPDLLVFEARPAAARQRGHVAGDQGHGAGGLRVLGKQLIARQDFSTDGYTDLLSLEGVAVSGRDAADLWQSDSLRGLRVVSNPLPEADLDGDGSPDLLAMPGKFFDVSTTAAKVVATSGRDGRTLWTAHLQSTEETTLLGDYAVAHLAGHILEEGHKPDVLVLYQRLRNVPRPLWQSGWRVSPGETEAWCGSRPSATSVRWV